MTDAAKERGREGGGRKAKGISASISERERERVRAIDQTGMRGE